MSFTFSDSPIHKRFLCFALAFIFICALIVPVSASSRSNPPIGYQEGDTFADIIAVVLDSWGISFSSDSGTLLDDIKSLLADFYSDIGSTASEFWATAKLGVNKLGQLLLDNTTVGKIIQFTNWLISEYNLSNNSSVPVYLGSFLPKNIPHNSSSVQLAGFISHLLVIESVPFNIYASTTTNDNIVCVYWWSDTSHTSLGGRIFASLVPSSFSVYNSESGNLAMRSISTPDPFGYYYQFSEYSNSPDNFNFWDSSCNSFIYDSYEEAVRDIFFLLGASPFYISTQLIDIPELAPDEGLIVTVPNSDWGNTLWDILDLIERLIGLYDNTQLEIISIVETLENIIANLQTDVSVNNIPGGVVLDYNNYDVPIDSEWGTINEFFLQGVEDDDTLFTPFDTLKFIIFGLPEPLIAFFSVIVVFVVAYGFIRMGRDSH